MNLFIFPPLAIGLCRGGSGALAVQP